MLAQARLNGSREWPWTTISDVRESFADESHARVTLRNRLRHRPRQRRRQQRRPLQPRLSLQEPLHAPSLGHDVSNAPKDPAMTMGLDPLIRLADLKEVSDDGSRLKPLRPRELKRNRYQPRLLPKHRAKVRVANVASARPQLTEQSWRPRRVLNGDRNRH